MSLPPKPRPRYIPDFDEWCDNLDDKSIFVEDALHRWRFECDGAREEENAEWAKWHAAVNRATDDERLNAGLCIDRGPAEFIGNGWHAYNARHTCHKCEHTYNYIGYDHPAGPGLCVPPCPQCSKDQ